MKWRTGRKSENIEDKRSARIPGGAAGIGGIGLLAILLISMFMGVDPSQVLQNDQDSSGTANQQSQLTEEQLNQSTEFVSLVLGDTEATWNDCERGSA